MTLSLSLFPHQSDIEIPIPRYFIMENYRELKEREKILGTVLAKMGPTETEVQHHKYTQTHTVHMCISLQVKEDIDMTTEEAIRLIQVRRFGSEIIEL